MWDVVSYTNGRTQMRVFENRVLSRKFRPKRKRREAGEDCIMRSFINYTFHQMFLE
jgi:hypothetical protein